MLKIVDIMEEEVSTEIYGGKAHGLSLLHTNGCLIPHTVAIEATDNPEEIDCSEFKRKLLKKISRMSHNHIYDLAVRSSCTIEDGFANSMAGHFDTFLGVMSIEDIFRNIKNVIAGIKKGNDYNGKMGVVIQDRISPEYSGVLFSSNPVTYSKKQMVISYVEGMGDKLVSGEACGTDIAVVTDGNTFSIHADTDAVLKEKLLLLAQEGKRLEKLLNYPLDIEWAIVGGAIYFLQCRPLASITEVRSGYFPVNKQCIASIPMQLTAHDKIKLRLAAQESDIFISDAYICIRNSCFNDLPVLNIAKSDFCKGYSAVIIYPKHLSNKVIRSFVGDKKKVFDCITDCCRYGVRSFPEYDNLSTCLNAYFELLDKEYWVSTTILQEIFDPLYTGVVQRLEEGFILEITKGHFLTKGIVPTSQYIITEAGNILKRSEIHQETWLKIIEGHIVHCVCDNESESLVALDDTDVKHIIDSFSAVLKTNSNVVEFGLLKQQNAILTPYLIDFVDDNSPVDISSNDIINGIISYGTVSGKPIIIKDFDKDSLNEHFHNISETTVKSNEKVVFFSRNPELALLKILDSYEHNHIGFVFHNCAIGAHLAVVLREKGIPAIKLNEAFWDAFQKNVCTIDAKTHGLLPEERLKYE